MDKIQKKERHFSDEEIRFVLDNYKGYGSMDMWDYLERDAKDPALRQECSRRASRAYHAEEYSADIL